ncbi:MAG: ATP-binding protein [Christensenellales bacterium]|jgi:NAD-dependent dihydropyrimidine dehydrogenase PreA subunit
MIRRIINIDEEKCDGCGICVDACHEGAIAMVDGKAKLIRDDYCDGLGDCLPTCPTGAITFVEREAAAFDEEAVKARMAEMQKQKTQKTNEAQQRPAFSGCPGMRTREIKRPQANAQQVQAAHVDNSSQLAQWPVQIKLVPVNAPYFSGAKLLIAADCTAFAYGNFHQEFIKNHVTIIGCPKLDEGDYSQKLTEILRHNDIKSVTVARMEVPCCSGIANAAVRALQNCGKMIPWRIVTITTDGELIE